MGLSARELVMEQAALRALPELRTFGRVLYVGANTRRFDLYRLFEPSSLYVLEAWEPNVRALRQATHLGLGGVILGDVLQAAELPEIAALTPFDLLVWSHGPEHVERGALERFIGPSGALHGLYSRAVLMGAPWGRYEQAGVGGNPYEAHRSHLLPEFFLKLGYQTSTVGRKDDPAGHVTAWRRARYTL